MIKLCTIAILLVTGSFAGAVEYSNYRCEGVYDAQGHSFRIFVKSETKDVSVPQMTALGFGSKEDCEKSLSNAKTANSDIVCAPTVSLALGYARAYSLFDLYSGKKLDARLVLDKESCDELATHSYHSFYCHHDAGDYYKLSDAAHKQMDSLFKSKEECFAGVEKLSQVKAASKDLPKSETHGP